jgi:hypothetical protein
MWRFIGVLLAGSIFGSGVAKAEQTVNELLHDYDSSAPNKQRFIEMLVSQTENGLSRANVYLRGERKQAPLYCTPDKLALTGAQVIDILRQEVKTSPDTGTVPFGLGVLIATVKVFPCPEGQK